MKRILDSFRGHFLMQNLEEGWKKSELKDLHLLFSQMNTDLCLQIVNAYLLCSWKCCTNRILWMFKAKVELKNHRKRIPVGGRRSIAISGGSYPPRPACRLGSTHLSLKGKRGGLSLWQSVLFCYLAIMPGSFLSRNSCMHWCSVELLRNLRKDSTYLLWSENKLLMEDAMFGFLRKTGREGRSNFPSPFPGSFFLSPPPTNLY